MTSQSILILLFGAIIVALGAAIIGGMARRYRRMLGLEKKGREKTEDVSFIINAFQDVARQLKEKEKELERLKSLAEQRADTVETYAKNVLECVTSGVITFDTNGVATTMNRAAEEILGTAAKETLGKTCADVFGNGEISRLINGTIESNATSMRMETMLMRRGERVWLGFNTAPLNDKGGRSLGVILSFSDLTEVKRLQEQMELKERLTALGEMSAGIAHELRNPMGVITGYLNLLAKRQDEASGAIIRDVMAEINNMNRIIGDLLTFARPTSLNRVKIDIRDMIEGCVSSLMQTMGPSGGVEKDMKLDPVEVFADEVLMRQALSNLLQNAVEAMPDGGRLTVEARSGKEVVITISDTGKGIPRETIKKIFLPFFTTKDQGVGMGLALAHKILTSHGGRIEVESEEGKGTTFTVTLPKG